MFSSLCGPSIIYIGFSLINIIFDLISKNYKRSLFQFIVMIILASMINMLCNIGLNVFAWFLVFIPIIQMTFISILLIQTFGSNINNVSNKFKIEDISANQISDNRVSNIPSASLENVDTKKIDRDKIRYKFYDKIEKQNNLNSNPEHKYDLSNNIKKFNIVNFLINSYDENYNINKKSHNELLNNFIINNRLTNYIDYENYKINVTNRGSNIIENSNNSYENRYDTEYNLDGYLLFEEAYYTKVKNYLVKNIDNDIGDISINKELENRWNNLSSEDQTRWNNLAQRSSKNSDYEPDNFSSYKYTNNNLTRAMYPYKEAKRLNRINNFDNCPINETPYSFKLKTGRICNEVCPPNETRDSLGICRDSTGE